MQKGRLVGGLISFCSTVRATPVKRTHNELAIIEALLQHRLTAELLLRMVQDIVFQHGELIAILVDDMSLSPGAERVQDRLKTPAVFTELIFHFRRNLVVDDPVHDTVIL
ncbi:hypothetical protein D3C71_1660990 [compost metagenome]